MKKKRIKSKVKGDKPPKINLEYNREHYIQYAKQSSRIMYWLVLLLLTICNFLIFAFLVPFMLILKATHLFLIVGTIGFVFGLIFNFLINDIEHLEPKHHKFAAAFIPSISVLNIFMLVSIQQFLRGFYSYTNLDKYYASFIYIVLFMIPYALNVFGKK